MLFKTLEVDFPALLWPCPVTGFLEFFQLLPAHLSTNLQTPPAVRHAIRIILEAAGCCSAGEKPGTFVLARRPLQEAWEDMGRYGKHGPTRSDHIRWANHCTSNTLLLALRKLLFMQDPHGSARSLLRRFSASDSRRKGQLRLLCPEMCPMFWP